MPKLYENWWIDLLGVLCLIGLVAAGMGIPGAKLWMVLAVIAAGSGLCLLAGWLIAGTQR